MDTPGWRSPDQDPDFWGKLLSCCCQWQILNTWKCCSLFPRDKYCKLKCQPWSVSLSRYFNSHVTLVMYPTYYPVAIFTPVHVQFASWMFENSSFIVKNRFSIITFMKLEVSNVFGVGKLFIFGVNLQSITTCSWYWVKLFYLFIL